jgi:hypothetical protein
MPITKERLGALIRAAKAWEEYGLDQRTAIRRLISAVHTEQQRGTPMSIDQLQGALSDLISNHMLPDHEHTARVAKEEALLRANWGKNERSKSHMSRRRAGIASAETAAWVSARLQQAGLRDGDDVTLPHPTTYATAPTPQLSREAARGLALGIAKARELATQDDLQPSGLDAADVWALEHPGSEDAELDLDAEPGDVS